MHYLSLQIDETEYFLEIIYKNENRPHCDCNIIEAFKKIGERKLVAGQEDLIFNVLYNLKNEKKK